MTVYEPKGIFEAIVAVILRWTLKLFLMPVFHPRFSIAFQRRWLQGLSKVTLVPRGVRFEPAVVGGVPGEWVRVEHGASAKAGVLLYLHGGGYCVGGPDTHRALTGRLAWASGLPVFVADYRLAPEHRFPAGLDDAVAVYEVLMQMGPVVIGGDSAGGGLALATALKLRDRGIRQAAGLVLLSPWADLRAPSPPVVAPPGEAMLSEAWTQACTRYYLGDTPATNPLVSPLLADLQGMPPTLIQAGTDEMLYGQALQLAEAMQLAGVRVNCEITKNRWHVFQTHGGAMRSADDAIARIARFVNSALPAATPPQHSRHDVVILGAGMSGLCMGVQLKRAGIHNFVILEKQSGLGGTWWDNTYPGAQVDVPAPVYSLSFAPNPNWKRRFAAAPEIQVYMQGVAERYGLLAHMRMSTCITDAHFEERTGHWSFATDRGDTLEAPFFVCSTGPLNQVRWPDIAGLETFAGKRMHSARWDHSFALGGQRVGVIGTGSTASQIIPEVAKQAGQLHVFQRTANWVLPRLERRYNAIDHMLAHVPLYTMLVRRIWVAGLEMVRRGFSEGTWMRRRLLQLAAYHLRKGLPDAQLRAKLTPNYPLGCKRLIFSNELLPTYLRPNVELVTQGIERITPTGIVLKDGSERALDVLVCATGFETVQLLSSVKVTGLQGRTLRDAWAGGPEAFHGITVTGFPNMFLMLGPNTATGHTSTLLYIEPEVQHAIQCMQAVKAGKHRWIEVRSDVMRDHNVQLQQQLGGSVWSQCNSWYRMDSGRITALFPGFTADYVASLKRLNLQDYTLV